ncbi:MAG: DNA polymerase III subunit gamma/tau [SAR202 cluster bacterium]|nr:DNA polymerase III subunit gamma/tau [SAR202 cluster bacterium]
MSEVYYRKWRPKIFSEIIGQDSVSKILLNSVTSNRIAHAYIFSGPRGSGKTSTARILAKAINCLNSTNGEPDISCENCLSIENKTSLDLIEIDAASNRGIDDIRELSDKINFVPNKSNYKVYIIDEVHMLTDPAFNALLKTLEEPPNHAIFILATTDIDKVPLTIISRCHRLDFKRVSLQSIIIKLQFICKKEGIIFNNKELDLIARQSYGSLRDAENLLEQLVVAYGNELKISEINEFFHTDNYDMAYDLIKHILDNNLRDALIKIDFINQSGIDIKNLLKSIIEIFRVFILLKNDIMSDLSFNIDKMKNIKPLIQNYSLDNIIFAITEFNDIYLKNKVVSILDIELAMINICSYKNVQTNKLSDSLNKNEYLTKDESNKYNSTNSEVNSDKLPTKDKSNKYNSTNSEVNLDKSPSINISKEANIIIDDVNIKDETLVNDPLVEDNWNDIKKKLRNVGKRFKIGALLNVSKTRIINEDSLIVTFSHKSHVERLDNEITDPVVQKEVADILKEILITVNKIKPRNADDIKEVITDKSSHLVRSAQNFGAQVFEKNEVNDE